MRRFLGITVTLWLLAGGLPGVSGALPAGGPAIEFSGGVVQAGSPASFGVGATDPDGVVLAVRLCIESAGCAEKVKEPGVLDHALACAQGDTSGTTLEHVFDSPGTYAVTVEAIGAVCPGVTGETEVASLQTTIDVVAPPPPPDLGVTCAKGGHGGATDSGVTAGEVRLAVNDVGAASGIGSSFLGQAPRGLQAAVDAVNAGGGVCDRQIALAFFHDGWDPSLGRERIRSEIAGGDYFGLVSLSSEGLRAAIDAGDIDAGRIPVLSDGMFAHETASQWVWPVGPAMGTQAHVMVKNAFERGARTFGVVYEQSLRLGIELHEAFADAVRRLTGTNVTASAGITGGQVSYSNQVNQFNAACGCDAVFLALTPPTAIQWLGDGGTRGRVVTAGTQAMMDTSFARECGDGCRGLEVWTGFLPPVAPFDDQPGVRAYRDLLRSTDPTLDAANGYTESAYAAGILLAQQLGRAGRRLTRAGYQKALDSATLNAGISPVLEWSAASHRAHRWARSFELIVNGGSFAGFRPMTDWVEDPWPLP
jgi:ABC-type branched-subunit amino acid transport system substrate-binding protein